MDRVQEKGKKGKFSFKDDMKNLKENLKIKEILRTVKMNSSMRLKAPPGSKVMDNKDFIDNEATMEESVAKNDQEISELCALSATNPNVVFDNSKLESDKDLIDATNMNIAMGNIDCDTFQLNIPLNETGITVDNETKMQQNNKQEECNTSEIVGNSEKHLDFPAMLPERQLIEQPEEQFETNSEENLDDSQLKMNSKVEHFPEQIKVNLEVEQSEEKYKENSETEHSERQVKVDSEEEQLKLNSELDQSKEQFQLNSELENPEEQLKVNSDVEQSEEQTKVNVAVEQSLEQRNKDVESYEELITVNLEINQSAEQLKENSEVYESEIQIDKNTDVTEKLAEQELLEEKSEGEVRNLFDEIQLSKCSEDENKNHLVEVSKEQFQTCFEEQYMQEPKDIFQEHIQEIEERSEEPSNEIEVQLEIQDETHKNDQCEEKSQELDEKLSEQKKQLLEEQSSQLEAPLIETENLETTSTLQPEKDMVDVLTTNSSNEIPMIKLRNRKLSWDHTMLSRREGLSQSEVDLHSIGKLPLERKSSFFRKKMDSFLRNTTEMFKKQSGNVKSETIQRRGSMSLSLQSLNETTGGFTSDYNDANTLHTQKEEIPGSMSSLVSSSTLGRSNSTLSGCHSEVLNPQQGSESSLVGSQPILYVTHALGDYPSNSVHSLNESYLHDSLLQNRAISMSSGLDSQSWLRRKKSTSKSNRSNRVTWVASEGLTNYFRRMIQDENSKNIQEGQTYQDHSNVPENKSDKSYGRNDTKGRRWSYQRAVSGEDPTSSRYQDSSLRRKPLTEHLEENPDISRQLSEYQDSGVPKLSGFELLPFSKEVQFTLDWVQDKKNLEEYMSLEVSAKQAVICELLSTEADYLQHLQALVDVFIASAHALQDNGLMVDVGTDKLFLNIPDIYNANRVFWETTFHPMIYDCLMNCVSFNPKLMATGFRAIAETFASYEKYAMHHPQANDYLRSLSSNVDFSTYLTWCHAQKVCQRLQITDLLVKPIQRITKYNLILKRIAQLSDDEDEKNLVLAMDHYAKTFVTELNRSVKQRQELEKAEQSISCVENYEVDSLQTIFQELRDEEVDDYSYQMFTHTNLRAPMLNCHSQHGRTVIHEGDLRFKDSNKEIEVRAILFTDLLIICKKQSKGSPYQYKMIRPKYMIDKLVEFPKYGVRNNVMEMTLIFIVMVDDFGSCHTCFSLTESSKEPNGSDVLKLWEQKIKEAQYTYNLAVWLHCNSSHPVSELDLELASDYGSSSAKQRQLSQEDYNIEREAKERVATMMHRTMAWSTSFSTDHSHVSSDIASMSITGREFSLTSRRVPGIEVLQNRWKRPSTGCSSRNSRMSSFQKSISTASHDESHPCCSKQMHRAGSSLENTQPTINEDDGSSSVTVKVLREGESESELSSTNNFMQGASARSSASPNILHVQSMTVALVHSMPDLSIRPIRDRQSRRSPSPMSASEKLYQSHQENLKNRLNMQNQYLTPDHRGSSYPPSSPGRASLRRGLAFSQQSKPSLTKMPHVASQSALDQIEPAPSPSPVKSEKYGFVAKYLSSGLSTDRLDKEKEKEAAKEKEKKSKLRLKKKDKDRKSRERERDEDQVE